jgi:hypothetical protein
MGKYGLRSNFPDNHPKKWATLARNGCDTLKLFFHFQTSNKWARRFIQYPFLSVKLWPHVIPFFTFFFHLFWRNEAYTEASQYSSALIEYK